MRPVQNSDAVWLIKAYSDWHEINPDHLPVTQHDVNKWVLRWQKTSNDEWAFVNDESTALISYRQNMFACMVDNLVVHPDHRGQGKASKLIKELTQYLFENGALVATFKTLPGPIRERYPDGHVSILE